MALFPLFGVYDGFISAKFGKAGYWLWRNILTARALEQRAGGLEAEAGGWEAEEIRVSVHWANGLRSWLLPQVCDVATPTSTTKRSKLLTGVREGFDFWCQGKVFWRVSGGSRRSPATFLQGLATPVVRWEVSYEGKSVQKKFEF